MFLLRTNFFILMIVLGLNGCGGTDDGKDNNRGRKNNHTNQSGEPRCQKSGNLSEFTITCNEPIIQFHTKAGRINSSPMHGFVNVNNLLINFVENDKVIQGIDNGSGLKSLDMELEFASGKKVALMISAIDSYVKQSFHDEVVKNLPKPYINDGKHYCPGDFTSDYSFFLTLANSALTSPFLKKEDVKKEITKCEQLLQKWGHLDCIQRFEKPTKEERIVVKDFVNNRACKPLRDVLNKL